MAPGTLRLGKHGWKPPPVLSKGLKGGSREPRSGPRACEGAESRGTSRKRSPESPSLVGWGVNGVGDAPLGVGDAPLGVGNALLSVGKSPLGAGDAPLDVGDAPLDAGDALLGTGDVGTASVRGCLATDTPLRPGLAPQGALTGARVPSPLAPLAQERFEAGLLRGLAEEQLGEASAAGGGVVFAFK